MTKYIVRRLLTAIPMTLGVCVIVFALVYFSPYDVAQAMAMKYHMDSEQVQLLREELHLNDSFLAGLSRWLLGLLQGDLGKSMVERRPVAEMFLERIGSTVELALSGMFIGTSLGLGLGILAALRENSVWDSLSMVIALLGSAAPDFWIALMMIFLFSLTLGWLPSIGQGSVKHLIMPALVVGITQAGVIARTVRASLVEILHEDYVRTARAKGLEERAVIIRHALRNGLIPTLTITGLNLAAVLGGVVIVETVFARDGLGYLAVKSVFSNDVPVVQGVVLLSAVIFICTNLAVDIIYAVLDPRIGYESHVH